MDKYIQKGLSLLNSFFFAIEKFVDYIKFLLSILFYLLFAPMFNIRNAHFSVHEFIEPLIW